MPAKHLDSQSLERILTIANSTRGSPMWRFLWDSHRLLTEHLTWRIGNDKKARFWHDSWNGDEPLAELFEDQEWVNQIEALVGPWVAEYFLHWSDAALTSEHRLKDERLKRRSVVWQASTPGWVKLNFNGESKGNLGRSGLGAIVRDEFGFTLKAFSSPVGIAANNVAEISTLEEGNKAADRLANLGIEESSVREYDSDNDLPEGVRNIISQDKDLIPRQGIG
ncbi:hypothetical protein SUGI_0972160 [Cryptomeria japonica]|nr:hypothetical protein SUGI_0972160 [Cryptomeria japonica]